MKRRSFLATIFGAILASRLALELTAKEPEKAAPEIEGWEWIEDPYPARFVFTDGEWVQFVAVESGDRAGLNDEWRDAKPELRVVSFTRKS